MTPFLLVFQTVNRVTRGGFGVFCLNLRGILCKVWLKFKYSYNEDMSQLRLESSYTMCISIYYC